MLRRRLAIVTAVLAVIGLTACREATVDRDRDGLDDRLEASLATTHLPSIHEFVVGNERDQCLDPQPRPVLYRVRPRETSAGVDRDLVAITYVLLYAEDCGALGHPGDNETFTVFVRRDRASGRWDTAGALAISHYGTAAEQRSVGPGRDIWVSRNKHVNYAAFDACAENGASGECALAGPPPPSYAFLNVGEPLAPLSNDVGDVSPMFRGHRIWDHAIFLEAGDLTAQLFLDRNASALPDLGWEPESEMPIRRDDHR
jgi:hypothetical protein